MRVRAIEGITNMIDAVSKPEIVIDDEGTKVKLSFARTYPHNREQRVIESFTSDGEHWGVYSVYITDVDLKPNQTILDTNNCPEILEILEQEGVVCRTGVMATSGYCEYPVVTFTDPMLTLLEQEG